MGRKLMDAFIGECVLEVLVDTLAQGSIVEKWLI